jgi:hypothetical protein
VYVVFTWDFVFYLHSVLDFSLKVLRQIQYSNKKPAYYLNRAFKLICSELNGRFTSNEYVQTLTVIHPDLSKSTEDPFLGSGGERAAEEHAQLDNMVAHAQVDEHHAEMRPAHMMPDMYMTSNFLEGSQQVGASHAVTVIIVVCVGFLLFMIVLGVIRIRAAHHRSQQEDMADAEMAWDDSALNITVNPMEVSKNLGGSSGPQGGQGEEGDESWDEDDDASSYRDDESSSDGDDEAEDVRVASRAVPCPGPSQSTSAAATAAAAVAIATAGASGKHNKELEWDHSSM